MSKIIVNFSGKKPMLHNPTLVAGLPGIGNVGKIAADFLVDELKAKKICDIFSYKFPHSVFVGEDHLVSLPTVSLYHKQLKNKKDILILNGDVQPVDEEGCYELCEKILDIIQELKCNRIITLGGIGLHSEPKEPKSYCTGNSKNAVDDFRDGCGVNEKIFGVVGPIIGVSGVLLGLAKLKNIDAVALLAETSAHPMHLGLKGAKEILNILNNKFGLQLDMKDISKEIETIEKDSLKKTEQFNQITKRSALKKLTTRIGQESVDYIG